MEKKLLIQDLAEAIAIKGGLTKKKSEAFVKALFETIESGLIEDKFVKIKGLGTFKVIAVGERESVNINTGERFSIEGHDKITFTPETSLKDLVNRPFAHFQTVILNDETDLNELESVDDAMEETTKVEENEVVSEKTQQLDTSKNDESTLDLEENKETTDYSEVDLRDISSNGPLSENKGVIETEGVHETGNVENMPEEYLENSQNPTDNEAVKTQIDDEVTKDAEDTDHSDVTAQENLNVGNQINIQDTSEETETETQPSSESESPIVPNENNCDNLSEYQDENVQINIGSEKRKVADISNEDKQPEQRNTEEIESEGSEEKEQIEYILKEEKKKRNKWKTIACCLLAILILLLTYFAGYFKVFCPCEIWGDYDKEQVLTPTIPPLKLDTLTDVTDTIYNDSTNAVQDSISSNNSNTEVLVTPLLKSNTGYEKVSQPQQPTNKQNISPRETVNETIYKQVEGGKYEITGTQSTHKIEKGETIRTIAQEVYGSKGYAIYIITHNELEDPNLIDTGTIIKLPKLKRRNALK